MRHNRVHYHIHWSGETTLDWQRFSSRAEAETSAKQLALPGETYTIEAHGESCPQCLNLTKKISAPNNEASA